MKFKRKQFLSRKHVVERINRTKHNHHGLLIWELKRYRKSEDRKGLCDICVYQHPLYVHTLSNNFKLMLCTDCLGVVSIYKISNRIENQNIISRYIEILNTIKEGD